MQRMCTCNRRNLRRAPDASTLPEGTLIYSEDFDDYSSSDTDEVLELLGWEKAEGLRTFTMNLELRDGKLYIDNLADTSEDSYAVVMDSDYLSKVCDQDYTYEYDVTYLTRGNTSRYVSLLCNYDGKDNYNTVDMRIRGDGYNQVRRAIRGFTTTTRPAAALVRRRRDCDADLRR